MLFPNSVHYVIRLTNSITTWSLALMSVDWTLLMVENEISCAFITNGIPSSWGLYLSIVACQDDRHTFPHLIDLYTLHKCNIWLTPLHIWCNPTECVWIDSVSLGHTTQLGEQRIPHNHGLTGSNLCINSYWNVVIRLACYSFHNCCPKLVIGEHDMCAISL